MPQLIRIAITSGYPREHYLMSTLDIQYSIELLEFKRLLAAYALHTELQLQGIQQDAAGILIDWVYTDGT
jgi:hypothetical protein